MFESSFWDSGYPIGIAILVTAYLVSKIDRGRKW